MLILLPNGNVRNAPAFRRINNTNFTPKEVINLDRVTIQTFAIDKRQSLEQFSMYHISSRLNIPRDRLLLPVIEGGNFFLWQRRLSTLNNQYQCSYGFLDVIEDANLLGELVQEFLIRWYAEVSINKRYYLVNIDITPPYRINPSVLRRFKEKVKQRGRVYDVLAYPISKYTITVK